MKLGDLTIDSIQPVVAKRPRTKAGRLSMKGKINGKAVKVFECANEGHAAFLERIANNSDLSHYFPRTHTHHDSFIVCDWVKGVAIHERLPFLSKKYIDLFFKSSAHFFEQIHKTSAPQDCGFDYIEDFIWPRFSKMCRVLELPDLQDKCRAALDNIKAPEKKLSHADLKPSNVVFDQSNQMVIIDNELFGSCAIPCFDEINLLQGLTPAIIKSHKAQIQSTVKSALDMFNSDKQDDLFNAWMVRKLGSLYVAEKTDAILHLANISTEEQKNSIALWNVMQKLSA